MATARSYVCTQCEADDISNEAVRWCLECEEWLCTDCYRHHGKSKLLKQHKTITVHDYSILPPEVLKISNKCTQHGEKFERFCSVHGIPCCIQCITDEHKECTLRPLGEVLKNIKTSSAASNLEEDLINIKENFETITKHLTDNEVQVQKQKEQCLKEVRQLRKQLNDHLDVIEKRLTDDILSEQLKLQKKIATLNKRLKSGKDKIGNIECKLSKVKQSATDLQIFLIMNTMEKDVFQETKFLEDAIMEDYTLSVKLSAVLESLERDVTSLGQVVVNSAPSTLKIKTARQDQAQFNVPTAARIDQLKVRTMYSILLPAGQNTGCAILPDGQTVFSDLDHTCLRVCNSDGVYVKDIKLSGKPNDVCFVKDNIVAVSLDDVKIVFINMTDNKTIKTISLDSRPTGIDSNGNQIIAACLNIRTIIITDLDGRNINRIKTDLRNLVSVSIWQNKIFCTDWMANKILCYDTKGKLIWTYQKETIKKPYRISVDKRGFVYVAIELSNALLVITPGGDSSRVLLDENDGLDEVNCVSVYNDRLLLCNRSGKLGMYSLSH